MKLLFFNVNFFMYFKTRSEKWTFLTGKLVGIFSFFLVGIFFYNIGFFSNKIGFF
jgi:hypothetical protein